LSGFRQLGAVARFAQEKAAIGAIVKGGVYLETLGRVDTVVLDKTGTLTFGRPEVQRIIPAAGAIADGVVAAAAAAELRSEHPLGKAIIACARARKCAIVEPAVPGAVDRGRLLQISRKLSLLPGRSPVLRVQSQIEP
jgi:cation transport ATPase